MLTSEQLYDTLEVVWRFFVRIFAIIGVLSTIAFFSYSAHRDVKQVRADRCINSACEAGQKCSVRFQRHMGTCDGTR